MATLDRSTFRKGLLALRSQIAAKAGLDESRVIITSLAPDDVEHFGADHDVLLQPGDEEPGQEIDGGGRYVNMRARTVTVVMRTRRSLDQATQDANRLTDEDDGHLVFEDAVVNAVECFFATDENDNGLGLPFRVGPITGPSRERSDRSSRSHWIYSSFPVTYSYERDLDLPEA